MMPCRRRLPYLLCIYLLAGCALSPQPAPPPTPSLRHYPLLAPSSYGRTAVLDQMLEGEAKGRRFKLQIHIEIDAARILVVGLTPWQTRAFVLRYDGEKLDFDMGATHQDMPFPPKLILSDIQQVLWPDLPTRGSWRVADDRRARERRVYFQDQLVTHIRYHADAATAGDVELSNAPFGYRLYIQTLESRS